MTEKGEVSLEPFLPKIGDFCDKCPVPDDQLTWKMCVLCLLSRINMNLRFMRAHIQPKYEMESAAGHVA